MIFAKKNLEDSVWLSVEPIEGRLEASRLTGPVEVFKGGYSEYAIRGLLYRLYGVSSDPYRSWWINWKRFKEFKEI